MSDPQAPIIAREWMRHWTQGRKPVRWVVRDQTGILHGFANRKEMDAFFEVCGDSFILDLGESD